MGEFLGFTWNYVVVFLIVLSVLVFVHEWGHFWVARRNGVRVEVFSIGFGPELFGWVDKFNTRWKISAIPLGGYVKMFGEGDEMAEEGEQRELTDEEKAVSFSHKTVGQRAAIVAAGPIVNFLFAIFVLAALASIVGTPKPLSGIGEIVAGSAADKAGLKTGDLITRIGSEKVSMFADLQRIIVVNGGVSLELEVMRGGEQILLHATPDLKPGNTELGEAAQVGRLGVRPDPEQIKYERHNPIMAVWIGVKQTWAMTSNILSYVGELISGNKGTDDLGGPLRIAQISGQMAQTGIINVVFLMAILSINLGVINLFPVPMLDGGHLAFYAVEAITGKPLGPKVQEYSFRFGLILVLMLVVFVTWNDLVHLRVIEFIKELVT